MRAPNGQGISVSHTGTIDIDTIVNRSTFHVKTPNSGSEYTKFESLYNQQINPTYSVMATLIHKRTANTGSGIGIQMQNSTHDFIEYGYIGAIIADPDSALATGELTFRSRTV